MLKKILILLALLALACAPSQIKPPPGPPRIEVIYPKDSQFVSAVDSTFIFGNVTPGSKLYIDKHRVGVHPQGGFLAFLPLNPDDSGIHVFDLRAENDYDTARLELPIRLPQPFKQVTSDSLAILPDYTQPKVYQELTGGDLLTVSFRGTPSCSAHYIIDSLTDWMPMFEVAEFVAVPGSETIFGSENQRDSLIGTGQYRAGMYLPSDTALDSTTIRFRLCREVSDSLTDSIYLVCVEDTAEGLFSLMEYGYPQVVELIDSVQTIRHGPRKGYLSIFQPKGVRFIADGKYNNYVRMSLGPGQPAWIPDSSVAYLPEGTPVPYSEIKYIRTFKTGKGSRVSVYLDQMLPYRVEHDPQLGEIRLLVYYATSDTDWIRYDPADSVIENISWSQPQEDVYMLRIKLGENYLWGYDVSYTGNVLNLDISTKPAGKVRIRDLKFVIDPGHSSDPGAVGPTGMTEAEANLRISLVLAEKLEDKGAEVVMTRVGDEHVDIYDRPKIAKAHECDIFLSVHNNALPDGVNPFENNGTATFYYHPNSMPLAEKILNSMSEKLELPSYGLYYANFAVIRPTQYLAVLLECTFMMLPEEEARLRGDEFPEKCAESIVDGIEDFLDSLD